MKDKTQYEALTEKLKKIANNFKDVVTELEDISTKILPDVEIPDEEEEETWEMKCPYKDGDEYYFVSANGLAKYDSWDNYGFEKRAFAQGNIFKTQQEAELESKRRNLLTRFRAFRDECNRDWKVDWSNQDKKWGITNIEEGMYAMWTIELNSFLYFGYFKNQADCERAIELFGDEIQKLFIDCECD